MEFQDIDGCIFGSGYLLSTRCALRRAAAERAAAVVWQLSPRELAIQEMLDRKETSQP